MKGATLSSKVSFEGDTVDWENLGGVDTYVQETLPRPHPRFVAVGSDASGTDFLGVCELTTKFRNSVF
jgi:hypothetical protein